MFVVQTPLHLAVITDRGDITRRLLTAGASPNMADRKGQTCVHLAVRNLTADCLEALLSESLHLVDLDVMNYEGCSLGILSDVT
jgi:ankyrin repeat protein